MQHNNFDLVCFGEILWDCFPKAKLPGGAPMNVAVQAQNLGLRSALISRIGADRDGEALLDFLGDRSIVQDFIQEDQKYKTGLVEVTKTGTESVQYDIVQPVAWDFIELHEGLRELVSNTPVFLFGSLAAREACSRQTLFDLLDLARHKVLDINLRPPHYEWAVLETLLKKADTLKINDDEFEIIIKKFGRKFAEGEGLAWISEKYQINSVILTCGSRGAGIYSKGDFHWQDAFKVEVADVVGSGDAFLAAFMFSLNQDWSSEERLRFASAAGALVASKNGAVPPISIDEIRLFAQL